MQNDSNVETSKSESAGPIMLNGPYQSNAILTPELIHPNFFRMKKTHPHVQFKRQSTFNHLVALSNDDIEQRKCWATRQISVIANIPSTAVLGA